MSLFGDLFGGGESTAAQASRQGYQNAQNYMQPYYQGGVENYGHYSDYLQGMNNTLGQHQDPLSMGSWMQGQIGANQQDYYQNLIEGYNETPQAKYEQEQMMRAATQAGSASGMQGSGAQMKALQENAHDISSRDMQQYYQNQLVATQQQQSYLHDYTNDYRNLQNSYLNNMSGLAHLESSIALAPNPQVRQAYKDAQKHYADKIAPFEDPDIAKFTRQGGDPDTLVNYFVRVGKNDRSHLLEKLVDKITPEQRNILAHEYLKDAFVAKPGATEAKLVPQQMLKLYNKLGDRTREKLFPKEFRDSMKRYSVRVGKNTTALSAMQNPKTGRQLLDYMAITPIAGSLYGLAHGEPALAISTAAGGGLANLGNKALNSEWLRNAYLKGLLPTKTSRAQGGLTGGLVGTGTNYSFMR